MKDSSVPWGEEISVPEPDEFTEHISPGNILQSMHTSIQDISGLCKLHWDTSTNSIQFPDVIGFSTIREGKECL